jgi:parallel beta-helix repeat protein
MAYTRTLLLTASALFSLSGFAADLYVSPNGNDSNSGTQGAPFLTISRASQAAVPGTTVHVAPGTYNVSAPSLSNAGILTTTSGTSQARIRFVSDQKLGAKIVMTGTGVAWDSKGSYVDIDGFDITGSGRLGILAEGAHLTITHNFVHDLTITGGCNGSGGGAIDTPGTIGDILISGNIVRNIGYSLIGTCNTVQGIYIASPNNVVINNVVSGVAAIGIQQWHGATSSTIVNNTVFHNKMGILIGDGDGGALPNGSEDNYVANNIVYDNMTYGIIEYGAVGANNRYVNNLVYSSGRSVSVAGTVGGTINADPLFVRYQADGSGDYHLQISSPGIDKGASTSAPSTDIEGKPRDSWVDIGAYEYKTVPFVTVSTKTLDFGKQTVGTSSAVQVITVTNTGSEPVTLDSDYGSSGDFQMIGAGK